MLARQTRKYLERSSAGAARSGSPRAPWQGAGAGQGWLSESEGHYQSLPTPAGLRLMQQQHAQQPAQQQAQQQVPLRAWDRCMPVLARAPIGQCPAIPAGAAAGAVGGSCPTMPALSLAARCKLACWLCAGPLAERFTSAACQPPTCGGWTALAGRSAGAV